MSILSAEFLLFGVAVVLCYYITPLRLRWGTLLVASVGFAALSGWQTIAHLAALTALTWGGAWALQKMRRGRRLLLAALLALDLGAMLLLKYQPALAAWLNARFGTQRNPVWSVWELALPLGLSYFTFQSAGYLVDVYRGKAAAQRNPARVGLFLGFFPQLAQGPISTWKELAGQLTQGHAFDPVEFVSGFQLLLWGYFKKMVVADRLAPTTEALLNNQAMPGLSIMLCVALYAIRLYMDFSGGMDVARGFCGMLGIHLPLNFKRPFFAQSVAEYWRRWHITLGAWFRSYVLYPLTISRAGIALGAWAEKWLGKRAGRVLPSALATLCVFLLIGLWHSASWNAVLYGGYFGLVMALSMLLEPLWKALRRGLKLPKSGWMRPVRLARTWLVVGFAQYFAFQDSAQTSFALLRQSFENWQLRDAAAQLTALMPGLEWGIVLAGAAAVLAVDVLCERKVDVCGVLARGRVWIRWPLMLLLLLAVLIFGVYGAGYDATAFLYTQF